MHGALLWGFTELLQRKLWKELISKGCAVAHSEQVAFQMGDLLVGGSDDRRMPTSHPNGLVVEEM